MGEPLLGQVFESGGHRVAGHVSDGGPDGSPPGVVLCHGFPSGVGGGPKSAHTYPQLADRLAAETGAVVLAFNFSGCEPSEGSFSLDTWVADVRSAVTYLEEERGVRATWAVGFGTGAAIVTVATAQDERICGAAAVGAPADFTDWARDPGSLIDHSRRLGLLTADEPTDRRAWEAELRAMSSVRAAEQIAPRPLLVLHGGDDRVVSSLDARAIADAHGDAELRIIDHAGHQLRHDPRAVAILIGWLDRTVHKTTLPG
jgi:pimeloyl-ACP methyl ester carboxylesterase